jgi:hypothetical protein
MMKEQLLVLAERCEAAEGPDRRLDAEIDIALRRFPERAYEQANGMRAKGSSALDRIEWFIKWGATRYTASLDAAMTLVPEGLKPVLNFRVNTCRLSKGIDDTTAYSGGKTMPLALCAAALRARASTEASHADG